MESVDEGIKVLKQILKANKKHLSAKEYAAFLEQMCFGLLELGLRQSVQLIANIDGNRRTKEVLGDMLKDNEKMQKAMVSLAIGVEQLKAHAKKFKGKKLSKDTQKLYDEIDSEYENLKAKTGELPWSMAVRAVTHRRRKIFKTVYPAYMKHKNRLYAKSK